MQRLIRRRLCSSGELCEKLAKFGDEPAIFYRKAPPDTELADGNYPQLILTADKFSDAVRGVSGLLTVDAVCSQMSVSPEELEPYVREELEGIFFAPVDGEIFMLKWQRTDVFQEPSSERTPLIVGATVTFEIYEFPTGETSAPDAVQTLNLWAEKNFSEAVTIGVTNFGEEFKPSRAQPAIYFDTERIQLLNQRATVAFVQATVNAHIFSDTVKARREWLTALNFAILRQGTFLLEDGSPLRLTGAELNFEATEIQGQLKLTFELGIEKFRPYAHPLMKVNNSFDERLKNVHDKRAD